MKKFIPLTLACSLLALSAVSFAGDEGDYETRTLRARHATTTGSPAYADRDMEDEDDSDVRSRRKSQYESQQRMEDRDLDSERLDYEGEEFDDDPTDSF